MGNACPEALAAADAVTADCDHDGVAAAIEKYIFAE
jgi:hydroxymethylpyrimidine pyrophosphatase-like HAD family hydrolase